MSYQVTLKSRNVLVPIALDDRHGERIIGPLAKLDTATAMVIQISATGAFTQEFFPLALRQEATQNYSGQDWELWIQKTGGHLHAFYLGVPDRCFSADDESLSPRTISVQVIGTSPLSGQQSFSGGVDISLQAQVATPLIPGCLNSCERFLPTLLPHNFIDHAVLDRFAFGSHDSAILMVSLQTDPAGRIPVSLGKHWDAKGWVDAVVENLAPEGEPAGYATIRGGCFYGRNRKVTHWFGAGFGLEEKGFREAAAEKIRGLGPSGKGAWVFWLQGHGAAASRGASGWSAPGPVARRISIRHPMTHRLLGRFGAIPTAMPQELGAGFGSSTGPGEGEAVSPLEALAALQGLARLLIKHQHALQAVQAEPTHADWSRREGAAGAFLSEAGAARPVAGDAPGAASDDAAAQDAAAQGAGGNGNGPSRASEAYRLEADIRALYAAHGESLRVLESLFDVTSGYSAWDAVGNPLRDALAGMLAEPTQT